MFFMFFIQMFFIFYFLFFAYGLEFWDSDPILTDVVMES